MRVQVLRDIFDTCQVLVPLVAAIVRQLLFLLILLFNFIWIVMIFSSIRFDYSQLTAFWAASDFSLWFRFRFQFVGILPLPFYILHILHILYVIFMYLSHSTFAVYSPNFGLLFFVGNLIHSFAQLVWLCYTCICFAGCTNNSNNNEGGRGDINFYFGAFVVVLLQTKHFCFGAAATTRTEAPGTVTTTTRTTSTNCAHSSVISL